jgi:hypothetical protein
VFTESDRTGLYEIQKSLLRTDPINKGDWKTY